MNKQRDSLLLYRSFVDAIADLDMKTNGEIYDAIAYYALDQKEPILKGIAKTIFTLVKPQLDANTRKWLNAFRGGAPKGSSNNPNGRRGTNQELTKNKPRTNQKQT